LKKSLKLSGKEVELNDGEFDSALHVALLIDKYTEPT